MSPFGCRNDARDDVERNQSFGPGVFAVDGERDADAMKQRVGLGTLVRYAFFRCARQPGGEGLVVLAHVPVAGMHFVVWSRRHPVLVLAFGCFLARSSS